MQVLSLSFPWRSLGSLENPLDSKKCFFSVFSKLVVPICRMVGPPGAKYFNFLIRLDVIAFQIQGLVIYVFSRCWAQISKKFYPLCWFKITTLILSFEKRFSAKQAMIGTLGFRGASKGSLQTFWAPFPWRSSFFSKSPLLLKITKI